MTALYALPDHEVIEGLIPGISRAHVGNEEALARIHATNGMVPLAVDPQGEGSSKAKILWADLGDHPFREWQYMYTVQSLAQSGGIGDAFTTDFSILLDDRVLADPITPSGFIFHTSRCGSTLTAKALARSPRHVVINQGGPLQRGFWAAITREWTCEASPNPENLTAFRNLVLAMARRRQPQQDRSFIKFISWNTLYASFIMEAFPQMSALFLYRDPVEVVASVLRDTTAVLWAKGKRQAGFLTGLDWRETVEMRDVEYLAHCFARYFETAKKNVGRISPLNYVDITQENFPTILKRGLQFDPGGDEMALMLEQFKYHSKDDSNQKRFKSDREEKRASITETDKGLIDDLCRDLVEKLDRNPANLFVAIPGEA